MHKQSCTVAVATFLAAALPFALVGQSSDGGIILANGSRASSGAASGSATGGGASSGAASGVAGSAGATSKGQTQVKRAGSCGTYMYFDNKAGACKDARNKKASGS